MTEIQIGGRPVGDGHPTYFIAEISANHGQRIDRAIELIKLASEAGADAVKLQTYTPDTMTIDSDREWFRIDEGTLWAGRNLFELYGEAYTPWEWHETLRDVAADSGIALFSTPFDATAVAFLDRLDMPALKIASFELTDVPLLRVAASTGRPLVISTGMAAEHEIDAAVQVCRDHGAREIALLRCNSSYPARPDEMDLRTIVDMQSRWNVPIGLSDHTMSHSTAIAAVALGASLIEKHITVRRSDGGPDAAFSLEPDELAELVSNIRETERSLGTVRYGPTESERHSLAFRRSIFVVRDIAEGEAFTMENVRVIRPANGLEPRHLDDVIGRRASAAIERGTPLEWSLVEANGRT